MEGIISSTLTPAPFLVEAYWSLTFTSTGLNNEVDEDQQAAFLVLFVAVQPLIHHRLWNGEEPMRTPALDKKHIYNRLAFFTSLQRNNFPPLLNIKVSVAQLSFLYFRYVEYFCDILDSYNVAIQVWSQSHRISTSEFSCLSEPKPSFSVDVQLFCC